MATPLRFRYSPGRWSGDRVRSALYDALDDNLGAVAATPWFSPPDGYEARRFEMDDGSLALFCWTADGEGPDGTGGGAGGYWVGNTETPSDLWRTTKYDFAEAPAAVTEWVERELTATLHEAEPWLEAYPTLSWFFLPVFCSKDGAETTRRFFRDANAGFPDTTRDEAAGFYESFLAEGTLDPYREEMAAKLGTSELFDLTRMAATMGEFDVAWFLWRAGYDVVPEIEVSTDHVIDYRAERDGEEPTLVEVTRPVPTGRRSTDSPLRAIKDTAQTKTTGQLEAHGGGVTLFVDCSSFADDDWRRIYGEQPDVGHRPAVVFRLRPNGWVQGYTSGSVPLELEP
ncbi:DUF5784 family protein [Halobaculum sp. MBLA0147]|uniref:DUF5784 family protein n=1 Tax=Halobaculum sp. MBLA0147 TaxID=3079934 RepID=UPI003524CFF5